MTTYQVTVGTESNTHCDESFGGTSAAAPAAAGVFALALSANKELSWRDIQYLCVETALAVDKNIPWDTLPSGRKYSDQQGFGYLDAKAFVSKAVGWKPVTHQVWMKPSYVQFEGGAMNHRKKFSGGTKLTKEGVLHDIDITKDMAEKHNFDTIEHVQVKVWVDHTKRGDIEVALKSPNGVVSKLGKRREGDTDSTGLQGWTFMSLKHW